MKELLLSDEFRNYRKKQLGVIVTFISNLLITPNNYGQIKGALEMAHKIIRLPADVVDWDHEGQSLMNQYIEEDFREFETSYVKKHLLGEE